MADNQLPFQRTNTAKQATKTVKERNTIHNLHKLSRVTRCSKPMDQMANYILRARSAGINTEEQTLPPETSNKVKQ